MDNTSDTMTLSKLDKTSDTPTPAKLDSISVILTSAKLDNTCDTMTSAKLDDASDTPTLARLNRKSQGLWECEYSYGGEADLYRHFDRCNKNPGHKNFIPVDKFSIEDLPEDYRNKDVVDYIRAVSDLTVRVTVKYVSDRRPATVPGSLKLYPGYSYKGQRRVTVGTGWVNSVSMSPSFSDKTCRCKECRNSPTPETHFARISIITTAHMVFDELEAEHTTCHLFFDRGGTPDISSGVVTLSGMSNVNIQIANDLCDMKHFTHDLDLTRRLDHILKHASDLKDTIFMKTLTLHKAKQKVDVPDKQPLLFLVSHPHGCSKQISLGHWRGLEVDKETNTVSLMYTTPTCPGSSGALVCLPQAFTSPHADVAFFTVRAAHCGTSEIVPGVNFCRTDPEVPMLQMLSQKTQTDGGPWEGNFWCVEEQDQNQHYAACKKNPGHENFFPVDKFSMDNLPPSYQRDDLMEFIKLVSDLTVRVTVKYVSDRGPEADQGNDIPNLINIGSRLLKVGTGWIADTQVYPNEACRCKECEHSLAPATGFACLSVNTFTHVVYDDPESQEHTCHLLLDVSEPPSVYMDQVTLADMCDESYNMKPTRKLKYLTHNLQFADRLTNTTRKQGHYIISLTRNEDARPQDDDPPQTNGNNTKQEPRLDIVVSDPQENARHISYGNPDEAEVRGKLYPCTLINVLGFSEARIIVLGVESTHCGSE